MFDGRLTRAAVIICIGITLSGCYYMQAARGQLDVMRRSEPIAVVVAASDTPEDLSRRLQMVEQARDFSIDELGLPDNDSYRLYADLGRNYIVWNVFAAPEFSLEAKTWCFPVAGCVSYRGYFAEDAAEREAANLAERGYDVAVGGIAAYSTLGRFDDPVLNTMMHWEDVDLIATMFHELAHQVLYIKGATAFNESFATVVEEAGIERWLSSREDEEELDAYREKHELRQRVMHIVDTARKELGRLYMTRVAPDEMRKRKSKRLTELVVELTAEFDKAGRPAPVWLTGDLNNARLAAMALYHERVPELRELLEACEGDLNCVDGKAAEAGKVSSQRD